MSIPTDPKRKRLITLAASGLFVLVCGLAAPRLLTPPAAPAPSPPVDPKGASPQPAQTPQAPDLPSVGAILTRLTVGTAVVLVLCGGVTYWVARRMKGKPPPADGPLKILGTLSVGRGHVYLVQAGDQRLLAGVDVTGLKSLVHLPATEADLDEPTVIAERVAVPAEFNEILVNRVGGPPTS
jgi:flagellar biogenesis protein FliO